MRIWYKNVFLLIFCCTHLVFNFSVWAEKFDEVLAIVNEDIITVSELRKLVIPIYMQYKNRYQGEKLDQQMVKVQAGALKQLIENKLLMQEAKKQEIEVLDSDIEEKLRGIKSRFSSENEFEQALEQDNITIDNVKEEIKEQLLIRNVLRGKVYARVTVSPKEVEAYYLEKKNDFQVMEQIKISHVFIKKDNDEALKKAEEALDRLKKGEDFSAIAKDYSQGPNAENGGEVDFFERGYMLKEIEDVAFGLEVGKYSDIIETKIGFHIVYLKARKKPMVVSVEEAWEQIEDILFQQKAEKRYETYVDSLKKDAYIKLIKE